MNVYFIRNDGCYPYGSSWCHKDVIRMTLDMKESGTLCFMLNGIAQNLKYETQDVNVVALDKCYRMMISW